MKLDLVLCLATAAYAAPIPGVLKRLASEVQAAQAVLGKSIKQWSDELKNVQRGSTDESVLTRWRAISGKDNPTKDELISLLKSKIAMARQQNVWEPLFHARSFLTSKRPIPIKFEVTTKEGQVLALEGFQKYKPGQVLITGIKGEQYVVSSIEKFNKLYEMAGDGIAIPKFNTRQALKATKPGMIRTSWSDLEITPDDMVTRIGAGDYTVVKPDVFQETFMDGAGSEQDLKYL
jgi:hypothetical protein